MAGDETTHNSDSWKTRWYVKDTTNRGVHGSGLKGRRALILQYNTHTCMHARTHTHTHTHSSGFQVTM